jgi:hypothetical protein
LERREASRDQEANFKISNEGVANGIFDAKTIQKNGIFRRFFGKIRKNMVFLKRGFRQIVRILWMFSGGKGYQGIGIRDSLLVMV